MAITGAEFKDEDVASAYIDRPDYPAALHQRLLDLTHGRTRVLDLGCGPGKLARSLAPHFTEVLAVDPSAAMLRVGRELDAGAHPHIEWVNARAEDLSLEHASIDLAVAGASLHWMNPAVLFPKLAPALAPGAVLAVVDGDAPTAAPWLDAYQAVIVAWVERSGDTWNGVAHRERMSRHEQWFDVQGRETFTLQARQHSRATWARSKMGVSADAFDADLRATLAAWSDNGQLTFEVRSTLIWGRPRFAALDPPPRHPS